MRANRERGEHGTENTGSCSGPNGEAIEVIDCAPAAVANLRSVAWAQ